MAAAAPLIAVPKNLYKHFAALTLTITACVAIFADGENDQAIAEKIQQHQADKVKRAQAAREAGQQSLGGLRDNRGKVVNGNDDVGTPPPVVPTVMLAAGEVGEADFPAAIPSQAQRKPLRKLPTVLPPGMPAGPNLQASPSPRVADTPPG